MHLGLFLAVAFATLAATQAVKPTPNSIETTITPPPKSTPPPGGWWPAPVTQELTTLLYTSLANVTLYRSSVSARVCVNEIRRLESQQVAGKNYRYSTSACDVPKTLQMQSNQQKPTPAKIAKYLGHCKANFKHNCVGTDAIITVYKSWDTTVEVSSIEIRPWPTSPTGVHASDV